MKKICVIGLGYIGLPTAAMFATHDYQVIGVDINQNIVSSVNKGLSHFTEPEIDSLVQAAVSNGNLRASTQPEEADAFIIAVPTPFNEDKTADMRYVIEAGKSVKSCLRKGNLVILESTSPPKTTEELLQPILEETGLQAGKDFHLAYSPERVLPGNIVHELQNNARIIGGIDEASSHLAKELFASFVKGEIILTDAVSAELVKLMENTYRDINIAVANEFARISEYMGSDIWANIQMANKHPRVNILQPGPGVGGHCISIDPWFLVEKVPQYSLLTKTARQVNDEQPQYIINWIKQVVGKVEGKNVTVLGVTYKENVDDIRESPSLTILDVLEKENANVKVFDPYVPQDSPKIKVESSLEAALKDTEIVLMLVKHNEFLPLHQIDFETKANKVFIFDTKNILKKEDWDAEKFQLCTLGAK